MVDPIERRLQRLRNMSESARRRAGMYADIATMDDRRTTDSLSGLQRAPAPGKKLQKIGFLMLWVPEPTGITCAIGGPMIVAGRYLDKKYNGATIRDVGHETRNTISSIRDFKTTVM